MNKNKTSRELQTNYLSFDIEIAKMLPEDFSKWRNYRPLGITCAALQFDGEEPRLWATQKPNGEFADKMSRHDLQRLVRYLCRAVENDWQIVTWNGLGFDFDVLAEESGCWEECRYLALTHIDMMFHFFCIKGFPLGLNKAAKGMGLSGKTEGMSGDLAPVLWEQGEYQKVLDYVAQDAVTTMEVAKAVLINKQIEWISNSGRHQQAYFFNGLLSVLDAVELPFPDTSWMDHPIDRYEFGQWTIERPIGKVIPVKKTTSSYENPNHNQSGKIDKAPELSIDDINHILTCNEIEEQIPYMRDENGCWSELKKPTLYTTDEDIYWANDGTDKTHDNLLICNCPICRGAPGDDLIFREIFEVPEDEWIDPDYYHRTDENYY